MNEKNSLPEEINEIFTKLQSEIVWLHGQWIIFKQIYKQSPERVELLNASAVSYFQITQKALINSILIYIGRITDGAGTGRHKNLSLKQIVNRLDKDKYPDIQIHLKAKLDNIDAISKPIRDYRNKKLAHRDFEMAFNNVVSIPPVTVEAIENTIEAIRDFMNECELHFLDSETAYEAFTMRADGRVLINRLKKAIAYDELERDGLIEHGYWRKKSKYKSV